MAALEAEMLALEARVVDLAAGSGGSDTVPALDSLDSLDPHFSGSPDTAPPPDRQTLLRTRERRLDLGLGVADLDRALADLDRAATGNGLSP